MHQHFSFLLITILLLISPPLSAKKRCKPLLEKLHNIQAMQRSGHSSKRGASLRTREDKARDKWWQCETGKGGKIMKRSNKDKSVKTTASIGVPSIKRKKITAGTPFKTSNAVVIKSQYQGAKKQAWFKFYQQPIKCKRPKSLSEFAFCSEDKQKQRGNFEQQYLE